MGRLEDAQAVQKTDPPKAEAQYKAILSVRPETTDAALKEYELALMSLGELYRDGGYLHTPFRRDGGMEVLSDITVDRRANELAQLVKETLGVLNAFAKSKTSKLGIQFAQGTTGIHPWLTRAGMQWRSPTDDRPFCDPARNDRHPG